MKRQCAVLYVGCLALSAFATGPTENGASRHAKAYGSDEKWWRCDIEALSKGCDTGTFSSLGLTKEEQDFVVGKLDRIPWRPNKADKAVIAELLGAKPTQDVGIKQTYVGVGPGSDSGRGVGIYYHGGSVFMVHWMLPKRFLLVRASSF